MPVRRREPLARDLPAELQVAATNGSILTDSRGRKYIDFVMGWCVANFGWRPEPTMKAIERFKGPDYVYPGYSYAPWTELARLLASLAPRPLTTCFRATGGSEAVDLALQAALIHTGRRAFLSLEGSYHGNSLAGLSIGASDSRERIKSLLPHCGKIAPPRCQGGAAAAVAGDRQADRRERARHSGALDMMPRRGVISSPSVQLETPRTQRRKVESGGPSSCFPPALEALEIHAIRSPAYPVFMTREQALHRKPASVAYSRTSDLHARRSTHQSIIVATRPPSH